MSLPSRALECSPNNTACIAVLLGLSRLPSGPSRDNVGGCNIRFSPLFSPPLGAEKGAATAACILQKLSDPILFRFPPPPKEQACVCSGLPLSSPFLQSSSYPTLRLGPGGGGGTDQTATEHGQEEGRQGFAFIRPPPPPPPPFLSR